MYDDLKRARRKLGKAYIYDPHGRSAKAIATQICKSQVAFQGRSCHLKNGTVGHTCFTSDHDPSYSGLCHFGLLDNPLVLLRNSLVSRIAIASKWKGLYDYGSEHGATSVNPDYELLSDCLSATLLGERPSIHSRAWVRDIVNILSDGNVLEQLFKLITPKSKTADKQTELRCEDTNLLCSAECEGDVNVTDKVSRDYATECVVFPETVGPCDECYSYENILAFSVPDDYDGTYEPEDNLAWKNDNWFMFINGMNCKGPSKVEWSYGSHQRDCPYFCCSKRSQSAWKINDDPPLQIHNDTFSESVLSLGDSTLSYMNRPIPSSNDRISIEATLPCLNHNTSLTGPPECDMYPCERFPVDEMISFCSMRNIHDFDTDFSIDEIAAHCPSLPLRDNDDDDDDVPDGGPLCQKNTNLIDTMTDTYALPNVQLGAERSLQGDEGARGDGVHFNLGLQQTWWCSDSGVALNNKCGLSVLSEPTPQDRLARITYKTQPSDASLADAPMFVFSPSGSSASTRMSSSRAIPLDFNLNAVYKVASRDQRGTGDMRMRAEADVAHVPGKRGAPEGATDVGTQSGPSLNSQDVKCHRPEDSPERDLNRRSEVARTSLEHNKKSEKVHCCSSRSCVDAMLYSPKSYFLITFLMTASAIGLYSSLNRESLLRLLWDVIMHMSLVSIILVLVFIGLEANNLTENAVARLQRLLRGPCLEKQDETLSEDESREAERLNPKKSQTSSSFESRHVLQGDSKQADSLEDSFSLSNHGKSSNSNESSRSLLFEDLTSLSHENHPQVLKPTEPEDGECFITSEHCTKSLFCGCEESGMSPCSDSRAGRHTSVKCELDGNLSAKSSETSSLDAEFAVPEILCKMPPGVLTKDVAISSVTGCSVAETMTDFINLESSATQTDSLIDDDTFEATVRMVEISPEAATVETATIGVQAEVDARKVYQETERLQQKHQSALRRLQKKFLAIRRRCQIEAMSLKQCDRRKNELLSKLQLSLPALQKEKCSLMAERASIDRQYEEEKKKNRELVGRLTRLNQQFCRIGQVQQQQQQQQPPSSPYHWKQQYQHTTYQTTGAGRLYTEQHSHLMQQQQQQTQKTNVPHTQSQTNSVHQQQIQQQQQLQQQKMQQQSTLLQNQIRTSAVASTTQHCSPQLPPQQQQQQQQQPTPQQHHLLQQQQQQLFHQQRLPIFQLFNKSFCQQHHEAQMSMQQQPQPQQPPLQQQQQQLHSQKILQQ